MRLQSIIIILFGLSFFNDYSIEVKPSQITINSSVGQLVTRNVEIHNLSANFLSIKTRFDSTWISVFPSKFILLPNQKKTILIVFSINQNTTGERVTQIKFWSLKGGEQDVLIKIFTNKAEEISKTQPQNQLLQPPAKGLSQRIKLIVEELEKLEVEIANLQQLITKHEKKVERLVLKYSHKNLPDKQ